MKRIYHTWDKWECYPAGFYNVKPPKDLTVEQCEIAYRDFLKNTTLFEEVLNRVFDEWPNSCEHYLTNEKMNRIAWLGQAALCYCCKIPARFRGGYNLLTDEEKLAADTTALEGLNRWRARYMAAPLTMEEVQSKSEANLY